MRSLFGSDNDLVAAAAAWRSLKVCGNLKRRTAKHVRLSRELGVTLSAMTQIADRLEKARLVMREAEAGDRRVRRLSLTARAAKMMQKHRDARVQRMTEVLERVEPASREKLLAGLQALVAACNHSKSGMAKKRAA